MRAVTTTTFYAFDGKEFETFDGCQEYESSIYDDTLLDLGFVDITWEMQNLTNVDDAFYLCNCKNADNLKEFAYILESVGAIENADNFFANTHGFLSKNKFQGLMSICDREIAELKPLAIGRTGIENLRIKMEAIDEQ